MSYNDIFQGDYRRFLGPHVLETAGPFTSGTVLAYLSVFLLGVYLLLQQLDVYPLLPLSQLLWNCLVYCTPPSLVLALDMRRSDGVVNQEEDSTTYAASRTFATKSEAMRRILRLDGNGLMTNLQRPRSLSGLGLIFKGAPLRAVPGLGNWDNSCYQNSILQGLASLPSLYSFLLQAERSMNEAESRQTNDALRRLIEDLNNPKNSGRKLWTPPALKNMSSWQQQDAQEYYSKVVDELEKELARSLKSQPKNKGLGVRTLGLPSAKDIAPAVQAVGVLEEQMVEKEQKASDEEVVDPKILSTELPEELSLMLRNPLEGLLAQRVGCLNCGYVEGLSLIPFNCLTVPLGRLLSYDIRECLDEYTSLEEITGVDCPRCTLLRHKEQLERLVLSSNEASAPATNDKAALSAQALLVYAKARLDAVDSALANSDFSESTLAKKCIIPSKNRVTTTKTRQAVIARPPRSLVIHVNRSVFDEYSGMLSKNRADVHFPKVLDLHPWCLGSHTASGVEMWNTDPATSMLARGRPSDAAGPEVTDLSTSHANYALRALVTHYGRHENGHYIAYRQTPSSTGTVDLDSAAADTQAPQWWRLSDDDVSPVSEGNVLAQGGVFMLFYERIEDADDASAIMEEGQTAKLTKEAHIGSPSQESSFSEKERDISLTHHQSQVSFAADEGAEPKATSKTDASSVLLDPPADPSDSVTWTMVENPTTSSQTTSSTREAESSNTGTSSAMGNSNEHQSPPPDSEEKIAKVSAPHGQGNTIDSSSPSHSSTPLDGRSSTPSSRRPVAGEDSCETNDSARQEPVVVAAPAQAVSNDQPDESDQVIESRQDRTDSISNYESQQSGLLPALHPHHSSPPPPPPQNPPPQHRIPQMRTSRNGLLNDDEMSSTARENGGGRRRDGGMGIVGSSGSSGMVQAR